MKVSIIIPYLKDRGFLQAAINSVEMQTYPDIELILSQSTNHVGYNINTGLQKANGEFVRFLCDDDLLTPRSIEWQVQCMGEYDFTHACAINFWHGRQRLQPHIPAVEQPTFEQLLGRNYIHGGTVMYRRDGFERFGYFDDTLWTGDELDLHLKWLKNGAKLGYCPHDVYRYRRHSKQKSLGEGVHMPSRVEAIQEIRNR